MNKNHCSCGCGKEIGMKSKWAKGHNPNKNKDRFDWSNLASDYKELKSTTAIAEKYGCSHEAVSYQLAKIGVVPNTKIHIDNIAELYKEYKSINKVAEKVGCSTTTIRERLYEMGHQFTHDNKEMNVEVGLGRYGERIALCLLGGSIDMNTKDIHSPYDLEWNGKKIDVKVSKPRKRQRGQDQYSFSTRNSDCDYFLLIALDKENYPRRLFLIPKKEILGVSVAFPYDFNSKWNDYKMEVDSNELRKAVQYAKRVE